VPLVVVTWRFAGVVEEVTVGIGQVRETDFVADLGDGFVAALQKASRVGETEFSDQVAEILASGALELF
jgi:hypothetical protein